MSPPPTPFSLPHISRVFLEPGLWFLFINSDQRSCTPTLNRLHREVVEMKEWSHKKGQDPACHSLGTRESALSCDFSITHFLTCKWGSDQIRSVTQSCPTLCDPMNRSTPGLPVHHQLPEFTQTHIHRVSDSIQPSHPLSSPSPPAPNPSQHQSLFQ